MIFHAVHDMLCFMIVGAIVGTYMIRKSVRADIVDVWKERWSVDAEVA